MTWIVDGCVNNPRKCWWIHNVFRILTWIRWLLTRFALACQLIRRHVCMYFHVQFNGFVPTCINKPVILTTKWWVWNQIWPFLSCVLFGPLWATIRTDPNSRTTTGILILPRPSFQVDNLLCLEPVQEACVQGRPYQRPSGSAEALWTISHSSFPEQTTLQ